MKRLEFFILTIIAGSASGMFWEFIDIWKLDNERGLATTGSLYALYFFLFLSVIVVPVGGAWLRMQDAGYSKWLSLLMAIPLISLFPLCVGYFVPSKTDR